MRPNERAPNARKMAAALWLFAGVTYNTIGDYKPPTPAIVAQPTSPTPVENSLGNGNYQKLSAQNVVIASHEQLHELPNVDVILHDGVWFIEIGLIAVAALLILSVVLRFATAHDCWRRHTTKPQRLPLNLARQKAERGDAKARKNE